MVVSTETVRAGKRPVGLVLYRGPSLLNGAPIAVVAVGLARRSKNQKTGNMVATYILVDDGENPIKAVKSGADEAVCGGCLARGTWCYVNVAQAPLSIYRALQAGTYPPYHRARHRGLFRGRHVRLGSYGDPAAVPVEVWEEVTGVAAGRTGYTHQWRACDQRLRLVCMASCDTACERAEAMAMGWRTFRIRLAAQPLLPGEFICPASKEAGARLTCEQCGACDGNDKRGGRNASPAIIVHGPSLAKNWKLRMFTASQERRHAEEETRRVALPLLS